MGRANATGVARWTQPVRASRSAHPAAGLVDVVGRETTATANVSRVLRPPSVQPPPDHYYGYYGTAPAARRSAAVTGSSPHLPVLTASSHLLRRQPPGHEIPSVAARRDATTLGLTPDSSSAVTAAIRKTTPARPRAVRPVQRHDNGHTSAARRLSAFMPDRHRRSVLARRCLKRLDTAAAESSQLPEQIPARGSCTRRARGSPRFGSTAESRPRTTRTQRRPATGRSPAAAP